VDCAFLSDEEGATLPDDLRVHAVFDPSKVELCRQLLEQLYEDSVSRYGLDHEQVRLLARLLAASDSAQAH
jgi:hypothetical protein